MLRTQDVAPDELSEVVQLAGELYDREHAAARERKSTLDAAAEMGIPAEYMERAAREVHLRGVEQIQRSRRRRNGFVAATAATLAVGGTLAFWNRPVTPVRYNFDAPAAATQVVGNVNPQTKAVIVVENGAGVIRVERFGQDARGDFYANLDLATDADLSRHTVVRVRVRGEGLKQVRLYLENGPNERWRSPAVPLAPGWQDVELRLDRFTHQVRRGPAAAWRSGNARPGAVRNLSFKVGEFMNDVSARGQIAVDDLRFE